MVIEIFRVRLVCLHDRASAQHTQDHGFNTQAHKNGNNFNNQIFMEKDMMALGVTAFWVSGFYNEEI